MTLKLPTDATKREIYKFYLLIYESDFNKAKRNNLMTGAFGYEEWGWRVVGITHEAITAIAKNNFNLPQGLQRDHHKQKRADTYKEIFSRRFAFEEWWNMIWGNDETILMTKQEHYTKQRSTTYKVDYTLGYFKDAAGPGMRFTKKHDGAFIKELCEKNNIDY